MVGDATLPMGYYPVQETEGEYETCNGSVTRAVHKVGCETCSGLVTDAKYRGGDMTRPVG